MVVLSNPEQVLREKGLHSHRTNEAKPFHGHLGTWQVLWHT